MQKIIKALALGLLALSAQHAAAHTNKTFLAARPHGVNSALERVSLQNMTTSKAEDAFGSTFQATAFISESLKSRELAQYFLADDKASLDLTRDQLRQVIPDEHNVAIAGSVLEKADATTIKLMPTQSTLGALFTYNQDLEKILPGLYFNVRVPFVHIETDPGLTLTGGNSDLFKQYLAGTLLEIPITETNARKPLQYARIAGKQSANGIADIDLRMGYIFVKHEDYNFGLNVGLTIPTGNHPEAKSAFEAIYGNGGHWGLGAGLEGQRTLWEGEESSIAFHAHADYRYLFTNTERRTFGITNANLGQYNIVALSEVQSSTVPAVPAANILTLSTDVTPGHQVDAVAGFTYSLGGLTVDLGYNLWYHGKESLTLRDTWNDDRFVYLTSDGVTAPVIFGLTGTTLLTETNPNPLVKKLTQKATLNMDAATTPVQLSHKILAGAGYAFQEWEYPLMFGVGAFYEIPNNNAVIRSWGAYCKAGIAF
jgi:hypothetical protein